jgi:hypothetical protein
VTFVGSATATGTVTAIAPGGGSFAIQTTSGQTTTFSTGSAPSLAGGLQLGDQVQVTYTRKAGTLTARAVTVTAPPAVPPVSSTPTVPDAPQPSGTPPPGGSGNGGSGGNGGDGGYGGYGGYGGTGGYGSSGS